MGKVILTDCDGVLLDWEYSFVSWMKRHGYNEIENGDRVYDVADRFSISKNEKRRLVKFFNESSNIGSLPPLRDAVHYIRKLHEKHGFIFHCITSLSLEPTAHELRTSNLKKLFGETAFEKFIFLDTGADKHEALEKYKGSNLLWVEDKIENAEVGLDYGLDSILIKHEHNSHIDRTKIPLMKNWKEVYEYVV
jgi:FMN phosphatase YigB (HAD superfamily)